MRMMTGKPAIMTWNGVTDADRGPGDGRCARLSEPSRSKSVN
jgi:hypothetical protein